MKDFLRRPLSWSHLFYCYSVVAIPLCFFLLVEGFNEWIFVFFAPVAVGFVADAPRFAFFFRNSFAPADGRFGIPNAIVRFRSSFTGSWTLISLKSQFLVFFLIYLLIHVLFISAASAVFCAVGIGVLTVLVKRLTQRKLSLTGAFIATMGAIFALFFPSPIFKDFEWRFDRVQNQVLAQKGVTPIVLPKPNQGVILYPYSILEHRKTDNNNLFDFFGPYIFGPFMINNLGLEYLFISDEKRSLLERIRLQDGQRLTISGDLTFFSLRPKGDSGLTGSSWVAPAQSDIWEFSTSDMEIKHRYSLAPLRSPGYWLWPFDGFREAAFVDGEIFVLTNHSRLMRMSNDGRRLAELFLHPFFWTNHLAYQSTAHSLYVNILPLMLYRIDIAGFRLAGSRFLPGCMWMEPGLAPDEIVANDLLGIVVLDAITLKTKQRIKTDGSIRQFSIDGNRGFIYVAHYGAGVVGAYSLKTGKTCGMVKMGFFPRAVHYSAERDRLFAGSATGVFEIDPRIFDKCTPSPEGRPEP